MISSDLVDAKDVVKSLEAYKITVRQSVQILRAGSGETLTSGWQNTKIREGLALQASCDKHCA